MQERLDFEGRVIAEGMVKYMTSPFFRGTEGVTLRVILV